MESFLISGICRCCASEGPSKNLINKYKWMGEEEVYSEMLKDCFDVTLHSTDDPATNGGICEVCITQLRNAYNFKKQVIVTEEFFKRRLLDGEHTFTADIKLEVDRGDCSASENDIDAADDLDSEMSVKSEQDEEKPKRRKVTARASTSRAAKKVKAEDAKSSRARTSVVLVKKKPNKATERRPKKKSVITIKRCPDDTQPIKVKRLIELDKHKQNLRLILQSTNATPLRGRDSIGFLCGYCNCKFPEANELKQHTLETHSNQDVESLKGKLSTLSTFLGKIDVTALHCRICNKDIDGLESVLPHLKDTHNKQIVVGLKSQLIPFNFDTERLKCAVCKDEFNNFKVLIEHMNSHYPNFICEICGSGFVNKGKLQSHSYRHKTGSYKCDYCNKDFDCRPKKRNHERVVHIHVNKRSKCAFCGDKFTDYAKKLDHEVKMHGVKPRDIKCNLCEKTFHNQRAMNLHLKKHNLLNIRKFTRDKF
ncbi:zinc finger protein weckle isoform X8 [Plutella xylostella]|uniref:zinc finger protein weckle isoform X8 n=1 Tax=Plutella xylostella TaxID=51655 RepID=UPI002032EF5C|nr:zinc finger protein weckle isoform X8 [Plutella xylostella]